jgi:membrane protease YdiL (CAAX protease family)
MHLGQGAAPIPLFFFSLGVGYLYRQTGRLWPCIIVHFLLNAFSMIGFGLEVISAGGTP